MASTFMFAGGGHGSYIPYIVFWGFLSFPFVLFSEPTGLLFWVPPIVQLILIGIAAQKLIKMETQLKHYLALVLFHFFGVGIALTLYKASEFFPQVSTRYHAKASITAIFISIVYWVLLYIFTRKWKEEGVLSVR